MNAVRRPHARATWVGKFLAVAVAFLGFHIAAAARVEAANTCYLATSQAAHVLCFLDFTGYSGTGTANLSFVLPDGSTLTGTIANTDSLTQAPVSIPLANQYETTTTFALGQTAYLGVLGKPAFYGFTSGNSTGPVTLSNFTLTDTKGRVPATVTFAGADAEDTGAGDGNAPNTIVWTTTGANLAVLQTMLPVGGATNVCVLSGAGTQSANCNPTNTNPAEAYILTSAITPTQSFLMSAKTNAQEGFAFAIQLAELTVAKTVAGRENTSDQFKVQLVNGANTAFSTATTTGTGTTATTSSAVVPGSAYTLNEIATSGTLSNYASTVNCANAVTSSTTLPAANTATTSVSITPALDDQITCTFTNTPLKATVTPVNATATDAGDSTATDVFTLKNTSSIAGTFVVAAPTITSSTGSTPTVTGYTFGGTTYTSISALNAAIAAAGATAAGGTISVGVVYVTNSSTSSSTDAVALPATVTSGTGTSPTATGTETDTIGALPAATSATNCYVATGANQHLICWLDFTGYAGGAETFSLKMPDGSILTGTATNTGGTTYTIDPAPVIAGVALGGGDYTGIAGKPVFYQTGQQTQSPIVLSNLKLTDPNGFSVTTIGMAGADAERTGVPAQPEYMYWSTNGAAWTELQLMTATPATANVCTLSAVPATAVNCMGATGDPVNAYLLRTIVNTTTSGNAQSLSMASTTITGSQGFAFGIDLSLLTATKAVSSRVSTSDQFTVTVGRATNVASPVPTGTPFATASTSGTGTTATATTPYYVIPNENYVFSEAMASGSPSALSQYATTVTCTNAQPTAGVTQVLPAAGTSAQSVVIVPQPDSEITCAFTNTAVTMTNVAVTPTASDPMNTSETDKFTLTNSSTVAGTFVVQTPTITPSSGTAPVPSGYTLTVGGTTTNYTTLAALNSALAGMTPTAANGSIVVGVTYTTGGTGVTSDVVALPATITSGTGTSAVATGSETDSLLQPASLVKTVQNITQNGSAVSSNTAKPGDVLQYVLTFTNTTGAAIYGVSLSDLIPAHTTYYTGNSAVTCTVTQSGGNAPTCTPSYTASSTTVTGSLPTKASGGNPLANGASVSLTFQVKVN